MPISQISGPGAFVNGGNALGADLTIGTLDAFALVFITNGVERARFTSTGELVVVGPVVTINSTVVDIKDRVIHLNHSTGANDPVPALISGIGIHRGAVAGVARDHADIVWDEGNARWNFAFNTGGDDITLGSDLAVKLSTLQASADVRLLTNAKSLFGRNATDTADVEIARVDASNRVSIAQGGANVLLGTGTLSWSGASGNAMNLTASGTGTVDVQSATGTIRIGTTGSARTVAIGTGAAAQTVQIGSQDTTSSLLLDSGTGNIDIGTGAQARAVNLGTGGAQQTVVVGSTSGASSLKLDSGTGAINIGTGAQARSINVGTGAAIQTVTLGSSFAGSSLALQGPTIGVAATSSLALNNSGGAINIGSNADAQPINIGTAAAARTITIGNATGATSVVLNAGTGNIDIGTGAQARAVNVGTGGAQQAVTVGSTNGASTLKLDSGTGNIDIGTGAQNRSVNVGTGAAQQAVTVGSTTAGSTTTIQGPTIGISSSSALAINNSGGAINIGSNADAQPINIGTGASNRAINVGTGAGVMQVTVGSTNTTSSLKLDSGTGAIDIGGGAQARSINIGVSTQNQSISIGTGSGQMTVALGSTGNANNALSLNAGGTGQITANARTNVKAAAGLYVTDASGNGIYFNQASGTTQQFGNAGTTTTVRMLPVFELANNITCQTDKTPNIGTEAARVNTYTGQTTAVKTHDAFTGSLAYEQTGAVQTTGNPATTAFTWAVPDNCGAWVDVRVVARDTGSGNRATFVRQACVYRQAGGTATIAGTSTIGTDYNPAVWGGVTLTNSGNNFVVQVAGTAATTINWAVTVRYQAVIANT